MKALAAATTALVLMMAGCSPPRDEVGEFSNDLLGNEIKVEALRDPAITGIVCHFAYFERGVLDRATQGAWFEDPSNTSIDCQRVGLVDLSKAAIGRNGEEIFSQRTSLFFKRTAVRRIVDLENGSILYVAHGRELVRGSAKMSITAVPLTAEDVAAAGR
jgi:CreA protein